MEILEKVIEVSATIDAHHQLVLDEPLPVAGPARVRVIVLLPADVEIDEKDWLKAASENPAFAFLKEAEEDIYTLSNGRPFCDQR